MTTLVDIDNVNQDLRGKEEKILDKLMRKNDRASNSLVAVSRDEYAVSGATQLLVNSATETYWQSFVDLYFPVTSYRYIGLQQPSKVFLSIVPYFELFSTLVVSPAQSSDFKVDIYATFAYIDRNTDEFIDFSIDISKIVLNPKIGELYWNNTTQKFNFVSMPYRQELNNTVPTKDLVGNAKSMIGENRNKLSNAEFERLLAGDNFFWIVGVGYDPTGLSPGQISFLASSFTFLSLPFTANLTYYSLPAFV